MNTRMYAAAVGALALLAVGLLCWKRLGDYGRVVEYMNRPGVSRN